MSNPTVILLVRFKSRLSFEQVMKIANERILQFRALEGLEQKYYLHDPESGEIAGLYLWRSADDLAAYPSPSSERPSRRSIRWKTNRASKSAASSKSCAAKPGKPPRRTAPSRPQTGSASQTPASTVPTSIRTEDPRSNALPCLPGMAWDRRRREAPRSGRPRSGRHTTSGNPQTRFEQPTR